MSTSQKSCKFGFACAKISCSYNHPHGRRVDNTRNSLFVSIFNYSISIQPVLSTEVTKLLVELSALENIPAWLMTEPVFWIDMHTVEDSQKFFNLLLGKCLIGKNVVRDIMPPKRKGILPPTSTHITKISSPSLLPSSSNTEMSLVTSRQTKGPLALLEERWAPILSNLSQLEILSISKFLDLEELSTWRHLLLILWNQGRLGTESDDDLIKTILSSVGRVSLFQEAELSDGSTKPPQLRTILRRLRGRCLILIDGDNFPGAASIGLEVFPPPLPPDANLGFLVISFVSASANFRSFQQAVTQPWFIFVHSQTNSKDASDHALSITASMANEIADINTTILVLSRDGFARETVEFLKTLQPERDIRLVGVELYSSVLKDYSVKSGYIQVESKELLKTTDKIRIAKARVQYEPEEVEDAMPSLPSPTSQLVATAQVFIPQGTKDSVTSTVPETKLSKEDLSKIPWRDYVCSICNKSGGLPDSHYWWMCPKRPTDDSSTYDTFVMDEEIGFDGMIPSPSVVVPSTFDVWKKEQETFYKFIEILIKTYVSTDSLVIRLSILGVVMHKNFVYAEKSGLKPLVERSMQLGLAYRRGEQGNTEFIINKEELIDYAKRNLPEEILRSLSL